MSPQTGQANVFSRTGQYNGKLATAADAKIAQLCGEPPDSYACMTKGDCSSPMSRYLSNNSMLFNTVCLGVAYQQ